MFFERKPSQRHFAKTCEFSGIAFAVILIFLLYVYVEKKSWGAYFFITPLHMLNIFSSELALNSSVHKYVCPCCPALHRLHPAGFSVVNDAVNVSIHNFCLSEQIHILYIELLKNREQKYCFDIFLDI